MARALVAMFAYQAVGYAYHRGSHASDWLFRAVHQMHHSAQRLDVPSTFLFGPFDMIAPEHAVASHRFNHIHPFPDGNGRVSRLMSHAMALQVGIGAHGLWSISRGLARGLARPSEYKEMMDRADTPRQGALDGRGNLSLNALHQFVEWFLDVAIDQVEFMTSLFDFEGLRVRLRTYVLRDLGLREACADLVDALCLRGALARGDAALVMGLKPRTASVAIRQLIDAGLVVSSSEKGKLRLHFGATSADVLFPRLFLS